MSILLKAVHDRCKVFARLMVHPFRDDDRDVDGFDEDTGTSMVSTVLVRASEDPRLAALATENALARRLARRFVAGETLVEGIAAAQDLVRRGRTVTLDLVGEHVDSHDEAEHATSDYLEAVAAMAQTEVRSGLSVKPSQLGSELDEGRARDRLRRIAESAGRAGLHVTLDMEDSTTTETTIRLVEGLHADGMQHVGCAVQAYLHRTSEDLARLNELGASVRLCKGAYAEPAGLAYQDRQTIEAAYLSCAADLLKDGTYPRFATHDHRLIGAIRRDARRLERSNDEYEFQMLYGVRTDVQDRLVDIGESLCVYLPYGRAWYAYFMRRLAERPANLWFFARALTG